MEIMVCYDGSSDDTAVLDKAKERAKASDAAIYRVSVMIGDDVSQLDDLGPAKKRWKAQRQHFKRTILPAKQK